MNAIDVNRTVNTIIITDKDIVKKPELLGKWMDKSNYHTLIKCDADVYLRETSVDGSFNDRVMLRFRKDYFKPEHVKSAYEGLRGAAKPTQNRGLASGERGEKNRLRDWVTAAESNALSALRKIKPRVDELEPVAEIINQYDEEKSQDTSSPRGIVWKSTSVSEINFNFDQWIHSILDVDPATIESKVHWIEKTLISETTYANQVDSGIAGWFDRYPRIPYGRATAYTRDNYRLFTKAYPYLEELAFAFSVLCPDQYNAQMKMVSTIDPRFYVPNTPFTTITVNRNFRTAAHFDANNASVGFSNICSFSNNGCYRGCELILPELGVAVDSRPGDLFLIDNQGVMHSNAPLECYEDEHGVMGERISIVAYAREAMTELGSWEYEEARRKYVELNKGLVSINGVYAGMWESNEWKKFGVELIGEPEMRKCQPELFVTCAGLDTFF